jgi:hypothetical protein
MRNCQQERETIVGGHSIKKSFLNFLKNVVFAMKGGGEKKRLGKIFEMKNEEKK